MLTGVTFAHLIRGLAILLLGYDAVLMPSLIWTRTAQARRPLVEFAFTFGFELLLIHSVALAVDRWNESLHWWGSPLTLGGAVLVGVSAWAVLKR